jgi:probable F420-dependent oxidoreductase
MELGRVGIWTAALNTQRAGAANETVAELEALGYGAIWLPEAFSRDPLVSAGLYLAATDRIVLATGIATIYGRDATSMACGQKTLAEAFPDRFLLGLGVSHLPAIEGMRGQTYGPPLATMRAYLDAMDAVPYLAVAPSREPQRVLAALGPKMLALSAERASGAHPYFVPVEHTAIAREILGAGPLLAPEQKVVLETDPAAARAIARRAMSIYLGLPNYTNNLLRLGFTDDDLADGGSDRLVDAIVVWGDEATIAARVQAHHDAGADHVCIQLLAASDTAPPLDGWRRLAPALLG